MATFTGTPGNDTLIGANGDDQLFGLAGNDVLDGRFGFDLLDGGDGFDTADYLFFGGALTIFMFTGLVNFDGDFTRTENLVSIEKILAGAGNDSITGAGGNEEFWGGGGNDTLKGSSGDDTLVGGLGDDALDGGEGTDIARYGDAPSAVTVNLATGKASGGGGNDTLANVENLSGSAFNDSLTGDAGPNLFDGLAGNDTMSGGAGNDYFFYGPGNNLINGGDGFDILDYQGATGPINVLLPTGTVTGLNFTDAISGLEQIGGSAFNDVMVGDNNPNAFVGLGGDDALGGRGGDDTLLGGDGNDGLVGDDGSDRLDGGAGIDTAFFSFPRTTYTVQKTGATFLVRNVTNLEVDTLIAMEKAAFTGQTFELVNPASTVTPGYGKVDNFLFDAVYYRLAHPVAGTEQSLGSAWTDYSKGATRPQPGFPANTVPNNNPNSYFDATYYKNKYTDLKNANLDDLTLFQHYNKFGVWEGRSPGNAFDQFDGTRYLAENPDVAAYVDGHVADFLGSRSNGAIAHYIIYGSAEQRPVFATGGTPIDLGYVL